MDKIMFVPFTPPHMFTQTSSMFQQGIIRRLADWHWHVRIGCSLAFAKRSGEARPDGTCGASTALEWGDEMLLDVFIMSCPIGIRNGTFQFK